LKKDGRAVYKERLLQRNKGESKLKKQRGPIPYVYTVSSRSSATNHVDH
jgi:hypothetical protein